MASRKKNLEREKKTASSKRIISLLSYAILVLLSLFIYGKTKSYDFAIDDKIIIVDNSYVNSGISGFPKLIKAAFNNDMSVAGVTRPVTMLSHALDVSLFGMKPGPQHQMNIFYYIILLVLLLYFLKTYLLTDQPKLLSLSIVLLFLIHPTHVENVANIKGRDDILCFIFGTLAMVFYFRNLDKKSWVHLILVFLALLLSFLSKETGIIFILLLPITHYYFRPVTLKEIFLQSYPYLLLAILLIVLRFALFTPPPKYINIYNNSLLALSSPLDQMVMTLRILFHYVKLSIWPHPLIWDYSYGHFNFSQASYLYASLSIIIFAGIIYWSIWKHSSKNKIAYGLLFFAITLAPVSNIFIQIASTFGERLLLIPSFGISFALVFLLFFLNDKLPVKAVWARKYLLYFSIIGLSMVFISISYHRVKDWQNDDILIASDIKHSHSLRSSKAYIQYLTSLADPTLKNHQEALVICNDGLDRFPDEWDLWYFRGVIQTKLNNIEGAKLAYEQSLMIKPDEFLVLINYGNFFIEEDTDKAIELYKKAVEQKQDNASVIANLAIMLHQKGRLQEAQPYYEMARKMGYHETNFDQAYQIFMRDF